MLEFIAITDDCISTTLFNSRSLNAICGQGVAWLVGVYYSDESGVLL